MIEFNGLQEQIESLLRISFDPITRCVIPPQTVSRSVKKKSNFLHRACYQGAPYHTA